MLEIYIELLPILLLIISGMLLKYFKVIAKESATIFLKLVFYLTMPALVLTNIPSTKIDSGFIYLPVIPFIIGAVLYVIANLVGKKLRLERRTLGVFIISALILNTAFLFPFVSIIYGKEGITRLFILDIGNVIMIFGFAYYQACKHGTLDLSIKQLLARFLKAIPLWAILISVLFNFLDIQLRGPIFQFAEITGNLTIPLLLISVGLFFEPKLVQFKAMFIAIFIRMGLGMLLGVFLSYVIGLDGITRVIAILCSATPVGYNTLTFSSIENLDKEFAAGLVSTSILIAILYIPLLIYILK